MKKQIDFKRKFLLTTVGFCVNAVSLWHFSVNAAPLSLPDQVCTNPSIENSLRARDTAVLGAQHASEHASARKKACSIASGQDNQLNREELAITAAAKAGRNNPSTASTNGEWSAPFSLPILGITSVLLHTGDVLFWSYDPANNYNPYGDNTGKAYLWNPVSRSGKFIDPPDNIWCGGQTILSDGRVFIAGGNLNYPNPDTDTGYKGALSTYIYNPLAAAPENWIKQPPMARGRWYPTVTKLNDNRALITSGYDEEGKNILNRAVELFTPSQSMSGIGTITTLSNASDHDPTGYYPFQYLLGTGLVLQAGPKASNSFQFDPVTSNWSSAGSLMNGHTDYGAGAMFVDTSVSPATERVVLMNGFSQPGSFSTNEWLDGRNPLSGWKPFPDLKTRRHNANMVILPDATLMAVGGNKGAEDYDDRIFTVELYNKPNGDPTGGSWNEVTANSSIPAAYHSAAILLPDATVLLSEDDLSTIQTGNVKKHRGQIYSPPYLFKGDRPKTSNVPNTAGYGSTITFDTNTSLITSAVLVAPGATTHANDMHQRIIKLPIQVSSNKVSATIPLSAGQVPPGYYMLFVLNNNGVPSVASFIRIT